MTDMTPQEKRRAADLLVELADRYREDGLLYVGGGANVGKRLCEQDAAECENLAAKLEAEAGE